MKLEMTSVQKLAKVLRILIIALFILNLITLLLVPGLLFFSYDPFTGLWEGVEEGVRQFGSLWNYEWDDAVVNVLFFAPQWVFKTQHTAVLNLFLWLCGTCSAIMLWQAKRVLDTILQSETFSHKNATNMMRAAVCCFVISAAALVRLIWSMVYYRSAVSLISYNTLFIPVFLVAGLVFIVMSALFRQAAELKEENDLTI